MLIAVTGSEGRVGRAVVPALRAAGHEVRRGDIAPYRDGDAGRWQLDVEDPGDVADFVRGADAVVHLAGIPGPGLTSELRTYRVNVMGSFNVFWAAVSAGVPRVVWSSTESVYGVPFARSEPDYVPLDEQHPLRPESIYGLSKAVCERQAELMAARSETAFVALRLVHVMGDDDYAELAQYWESPAAKAWDLWSHVHEDDVADAVLRSIEADVEGAVVATVSGRDTVMPDATRDLVRTAFSDRLSATFEGDEHGALFVNRGPGTFLGSNQQRTWRTA